jgi:hypothetical protein
MKPVHEIVRLGYKLQLAESRELNLSCLHHQLNHHSAKLILDAECAGLGKYDQFSQY